MPTTKKNTVVSKIDVSAQYTACISAITGNFPATQSWTFNNTLYKRGDLINLLQGVITAIQTTKADHNTWMASVTAEKVARAAATPVVAAFRKSLESTLGDGSPELAQYGFVPAQPRVQTATSKAVSAARAAATRKAKKAALASVSAPSAPATVPTAPAAAPAAAATPSPAATPPVAPKAT
jgi:hypothetical protein